MSSKPSKLPVSVSEELEFHIKTFLLKKGLSNAEAEKYSKGQKSVKSALEAAGKKEIISSNLIKANPRFDDIKKRFPKPRLLKKNNNRQSKTLSQVFQEFLKEKSKKEEISSNLEKNKTLTVDEDTVQLKILKFALKQGLTQDTAEILAVSSQSFEEAKKKVEEVVSNNAKSKSVLGNYKTLGAKLIYIEGLNLTCKNCVICVNDFVLGDSVLNLFCFHTYHSSCIEQWFRQSKSTKCPTCGQTNDDISKLIN